MMMRQWKASKEGGRFVLFLFFSFREMALKNSADIVVERSSSNSHDDFSPKALCGIIDQLSLWVTLCYKSNVNMPWMSFRTWGENNPGERYRGSHFLNLKKWKYFLERELPTSHRVYSIIFARFLLKLWMISVIWITRGHTIHKLYKRAYICSIVHMVITIFYCKYS